MLGFASPAPAAARLHGTEAATVSRWPCRRLRAHRGAASRRAFCVCAQIDRGNLQPWDDLIAEFEERSATAQATRATPGGGDDELDAAALPERLRGRPLGRENPAQYESLNAVEAAAMTAMTAVLWFFGRVLRLDSFLILFYPLPSLYVMMRWGPRYGNIMFFTTSLLIWTLMGPLYGLTFTLNSGLLALALGNALWFQWHWGAAILAGCFAKFVGLMLNVSWTSALLRYNTWKLVGEQVKGIIDRVGGLAYRMFRDGAVFQGPTMYQVKLGVAVLLALHSLFHVVLTHMSVTMILDRLYDQGAMARAPRMVPWLNFLKRIAARQYDDLKADPFARTGSREGESGDRRK
jgi:Predicted membrane protein (DUF2232)